MNLVYKYTLKTFNNVDINLLFNKNIIKKKIKKYIITKASFKYRKTKEQYGLFSTTSTIGLNNIIIAPKILEIIIEFYCMYNNKFLIAIKKIEDFKKNK